MRIVNSKVSYKYIFNYYNSSAYMVGKMKGTGEYYSSINIIKNHDRKNLLKLYFFNLNLGINIKSMGKFYKRLFSDLNFFTFKTFNF